MESTRFEFGPFTLDADRGLLTRDGAPVDAGHRAVLLLQALLRAEGHAVTKAELMDAFARTANLPAWFGHNWDALEESLLDLDAARGDGVLVLLPEITTLARRDADAWHTLLVLLGDVAEEWERRGGLFVVLVPDDAPGVESLPRIAGD